MTAAPVGLSLPLLDATSSASMILPEGLRTAAILKGRFWPPVKTDDIPGSALRELPAASTVVVRL